MTPEGSIVRRTWLALLEPRRLAPVLVLSAALVIAQAALSPDPLALPLGIAMCAAFVLIAPPSWRVLFPGGLELSHGGWRLALYGAVGTAVVLVLGRVVPALLNMGPTLLTARSSMLVCVALFLVGGWGLGRDIDLDARLHAAEDRAAKLERAAEHAELLAVRAHLDPHFLFNTLNAIAEWCRQDPEVAERAVLQLSAMLRTILTGVRTPAWPLASELALCQSFFALYSLRDPSLYQFDVRTSEPPPSASVPPMLLLVLAENAVKHGPGAGHHGVVVVTVEPEADQQLAISFSNPGVFRGPRSGGEGLRTVERRLALTYDGQASFTIATVGANTVARIRLPLSAARERASA